MSNSGQSSGAVNATPSEENRQLHGLAGALGAFTLWGVFPLYFKMVDYVPVLEIMANRIIWSLVLVLLILAFTGRLKTLAKTALNKRSLVWFTATTLLIGVNWVTFVWAVTSDMVLEASLGYYINPLVNVMLGMLFLGERLNKAQSLAIGLAVVAVLLLTVRLGVVPWVSLVLAFSFGFYGLLRKKIPTESTVGLAMETGILTPICLIYVGYLAYTGTGGAGGGFYDTQTNLLLAGLGFVTAIPLILFSFGAQRLRLSTVGLLQYIAPTIQVFLAIYVFGETFTQDRFIAFALIWVGLIIYTWDGIKNRKA